MSPRADLASVTRSFFNAAGEFFAHLADVHWLPFCGALVLLGCMQLARAAAWRNVLRAAYPRLPIAYVPLAAAFLAGAGINAILPARAGDAAKVYLVKQQIPGSSYPAVTSSFAVQSVFDTTAGLLVFAYALTQGLLPTPPQMPHIPALDYTFWSSRPHLVVLAVAGLAVAAVVVTALAGRHVAGFWQRLRQGVEILTTPMRYLREVASWQGLGWLCRFGAFWLFLDAFDIGGSPGNVMLVMSVQAVANIVPLTPGGAGAQQALLVATLEGPSRIAVLSYSVGTQLAMAAWSVVLGFAALVFVFGTTDWRGLVRRARDDRDGPVRGGGAESDGARRREPGPVESGPDPDAEPPYQLPG